MLPRRTRTFWHTSDTPDWRTDLRPSGTWKGPSSVRSGLWFECAYFCKTGSEREKRRWRCDGTTFSWTGWRRSRRFHWWDHRPPAALAPCRQSRPGLANPDGTSPSDTWKTIADILHSSRRLDEAENPSSYHIQSVSPRVPWKDGAKAKSYFRPSRRRHRGTSSMQTEIRGYQGAHRTNEQRQHYVYYFALLLLLLSIVNETVEMIRVVWHSHATDVQLECECVIYSSPLPSPHKKEREIGLPWGALATTKIHLVHANYRITTYTVFINILPCANTINKTKFAWFADYTTINFYKLFTIYTTCTTCNNSRCLFALKHTHTSIQYLQENISIRHKQTLFRMSSWPYAKVVTRSSKMCLLSSKAERHTLFIPTVRASWLRDWNRRKVPSVVQNIGF